MRLPSGDQATPFTLFLWPRYVKRVVPGFGFDCSPSLCVGAALAPTGSIKNAETAPMHPRTSTRTKASTDWREADHRPLDSFCMRFPFRLFSSPLQEKRGLSRVY